MALASTGTPITQNIVFNSAVLTVNGNQLVDISDVVIDEKYAEKSIRTLNSIHKRAIRRSTYDAMVKFSAIGTQAQVLLDIFYSSSSPDGSDTVYAPRDGQQNPLVPTVMITVYTDNLNTKGYQYTLENPTFLTLTKNLATEDFAKFDVEMTCTKISAIRLVP